MHTKKELEEKAQEAASVKRKGSKDDDDEFRIEMDGETIGMGGVEKPADAEGETKSQMSEGEGDDSSTKEKTPDENGDKKEVVDIEMKGDAASETFEEIPDS